MKTFKLDNWLPTTKKEVEARGWDYLDVILFSGDAYVDHPSFGAAVIGRVLEAEGLRVAIEISFLLYHNSESVEIACFLGQFPTFRIYGTGGHLGVDLG